MFRVQYEINCGQNYSGTVENMSFDYVIAQTNMPDVNRKYNQKYHKHTNQHRKTNQTWIELLVVET